MELSRNHRNRYLGMSMLLILGIDTSLCAQQPRNPPLPPGAVLRSRALSEGSGVAGTGEASTITAVWVDYLFSKKPIKPGVLSFEIDYRSRGSMLETYNIRYDPQREMFVGTINQLGAPRPAIQ